MALSMDEQRMLAEIERRLAAQDPGLATRLSSFRRPGPAAGLRTRRGKIIGSICTIVLLAVIGITVYAMTPFRAYGQKNETARHNLVVGERAVDRADHAQEQHQLARVRLGGKQLFPSGGNESRQSWTR